MEIYHLTPEQLNEILREEWVKGYRDGNLDGYYGERTKWKEKFPDPANW